MDEGAEVPEGVRGFGGRVRPGIGRDRRAEPRRPDAAGAGAEDGDHSACCRPAGKRAYAPVHADAGASRGGYGVASAHQLRAARCEATAGLKRVARPTNVNGRNHGNRSTLATTVLTRDEPYGVRYARFRARRHSLDCGIARGLASLARSCLLAPA